jgi:hypothetical protein
VSRKNQAPHDVEFDEQQDSQISPAQAWDREAATRALDELFSLTAHYGSSKAYHELLRFVGQFRFYSPFNAMLVHVQRPGATFVAPPHRWRDEYGRYIRLGARPLIILQPMGPVMFVFDVSDTEPMPNAPPLPPEVVNPFAVRRGSVGDQLEQLIENAKRDGVRCQQVALGSQAAGCIGWTQAGRNETQRFQDGFDKDRNPVHVSITVNFALVVNDIHSRTERYATLVHELAHLYCGHLGTPCDRWWPDRSGLDNVVMELEAESVSYMVCTRAGIYTRSDEYLFDYVKREPKALPISLECVMKAAGLIETMSRQKMKPRKVPPAGAGT